MVMKSFYLGASLVKLASLFYFDNFTGSSNIPNSPCIIASNHSSFADGPLLACTYAFLKFKPLHMIAYSEPFSHWLFGWLLRSGGCLPFRRGDFSSQFSMLRAALGWLSAGESVGIFPEGHINPRPHLNKPRLGMSLLSLESGFPIIPTAIINSSGLFQSGRYWLGFSHRVRIFFGSPIYPSPDYRISSLSSRLKMIRTLNDSVMSSISSLRS